MHKYILDIIKVVILGACSQISFTVPKIFCCWVYCHHQHVCSYVEFSTLIQKQVAHVRLNNKLSTAFTWTYFLSYTFETGMYWDSLTSIWVLCWFYNPNIIEMFFISLRSNQTKLFLMKSFNLGFICFLKIIRFWYYFI